MVRGKMIYRYWTTRHSPINSRGTRAKRRGRGYPEGVILSKGQGWWAQRNLPCLTTFTTESYPLEGCTFFNSPHHAPPSSPFLWSCKSWWCGATDGYMWCIWLHTKRKYTPQGGSISHISLPGVASYRRQPRAIESTTPVGLSTPLAFATEWNRADGIRYCHLPMSEMRILSTTLPFINKQICTNCPQHHNALPNNIISSTNRFAWIVHNIITHY